MATRRETGSCWGRGFVWGALLLALVLSVPAEAGQVTIVHWQHFHEGRAEALEELIENFEAENPDITIRPDFPPYEQYFDKLLSALATGTGPDVFQVPMEMTEQLLFSRFLTPVADTVMTTGNPPSTTSSWSSRGCRSAATRSIASCASSCAPCPMT